MQIYTFTLAVSAPTLELLAAAIQSQLNQHLPQPDGTPSPVVAVQSMTEPKLAPGEPDEVWLSIVTYELGETELTEEQIRQELERDEDDDLDFEAA